MQRHAREAFAAADGSPAVHALERALVGVTALHLCFLPWALGTVHAWSQLTSLGLALVGFILAILPRATPGRFNSTLPEIQWPAQSLRRFPIFWLGLALLGYVAIQAANPAWQYVRQGNAWWLQPADHVAWLPAGVAAPFAIANGWRALVVWGSLWLLTCSVWAGFRRRASYRALFFLLVGNSGLLAVVAVAQRLTGAQQIFWSYRPSNQLFFGPFIYPNHAGAYFNLLTALASGLACWCWERPEGSRPRRLGAGGSALAALAGGVAVVLSFSRGAIGLLFVFALVIGGVLAVRLFAGAGPLRARRGLVSLLGAGGVGLVLGLAAVRSDVVWRRFAGLAANPIASVEDRTLARQAAGDMLADNWRWGWGAGCFRYGFEAYVARYPAISQTASGGHRYWEHAHNDLLEFAIELGVAGLLPVTVIAGYVAWQLVRRRARENIVALCLALGGALTVAHGWFDFVFQNPAVLLTWGVLLVAAMRWVELDRTARYGQTVSRRTGYIPAPRGPSPA